jgi:hypothetical protein
MKKDKLIEIIINLLQTDTNLEFLMDLKKEELETLVACIRNRVDNIDKSD